MTEKMNKDLAKRATKDWSEKKDKLFQYFVFQYCFNSVQESFDQSRIVLFSIFFKLLIISRWWCRKAAARKISNTCKFGTACYRDTC